MLHLWVMTVLAQTDERIWDRVPLWAIGLAMLLVISFAVVWTLHEEEGEKSIITPETEREAVPVVETRMVVMETAVAPSPSHAIAPIQADDLTRIEGIGPKISSLLQNIGITTFAQLASADVETLRQMLLEAKLRIANPETWPQQASLAAAGDWTGLADLQNSLKGGRRA